MKYFFNVVILLISLVSCFQANAQNNILTFDQLLKLGFENNFDIKLRKLSLNKADYSLLKARGALNVSISTDLTYGEGVNPSLDNDGTQILESKFIVPTKLGIDFYSGFRAERTIEFGSPNTPFNASGAFAGVKIPLLRGLGKTSPLNTGIEVSKTNKEALEKEFSNEILNYFSRILINYLTLKEVVQEYNISKDILNESKRYKEQIFTLAKNDQIPLSEKSRANSLYIGNLQKLTIAKMQASQVYYGTKNLLGIDQQKPDSIPTLLDIFPDPKKDEIFAFIAEKENNIDSLIKSTPQYKSISLGINANEILLNNSKNQRKNPLNLDIRVSSFGSYENDAFNLRRTFNGTPGTSLLVTLSHVFPVRNQQRKGAYLEQLAEYNISKTNLEQYLFESTVNVNLNLNLLRQKTEMYDEAKLLTELTKQNYQDEVDKYKLGNSTQTDIIVTLNNYFDALKSLNSLKYDVWKTYVDTKFILGELPKNEDELNRFLFSSLFY